MIRYRNIDPSLLLDIAEIRGRWHNTVYYVRGGKQCKRGLGNMNGDRWRKDDAFANTRGAAREFGAACGLSAAIRNGLGNLAHDIGGKRPLHTRLTRRLIEGFGALEGPRGDRPLIASVAGQQLVGFAWDKHGRTDIHQFGAGSLTYDPIVYKRRVHFRWLDQLTLPGWATHMRVSLVTVGISDMVRNGRGEKYRPLSRKLHGASAKVVGELVPVEVLRRPQHGVEGLSVRPDLLFKDQVGDAGDGMLLSFLAIEGVIVAEDGRVVDARCLALESVEFSSYVVCGVGYEGEIVNGKYLMVNDIDDRGDRKIQTAWFGAAHHKKFAWFDIEGKGNTNDFFRECGTSPWAEADASAFALSGGVRAKCGLGFGNPRTSGP